MWATVCFAPLSKVQGKRIKAGEVHLRDQAKQEAETCVLLSDSCHVLPHNNIPNLVNGALVRLSSPACSCICTRYVSGHASGLTGSELICSKAKDSLPPTGRPTSLPVQKLLYVNILPGYDADMRLGFERLKSIVSKYYPSSTVQVWFRFVQTH
jgi:hypothetical protein